MEPLQGALDRAYFYLKFRPRTKKEVHDYLVKKGKQFHWSSDVIASALEKLIEQDLINDLKFTEWFVEQRNQTKQKSQFALRSELLRFGVSKEVIDEFFTNTPIEEESLALEALKRKWSRFERLNKRERFQKAAAFLSRRGFSFDLVKKAITQMEESS